jgi:hypothetical protein
MTCQHLSKHAHTSAQTRGTEAEESRGREGRRSKQRGRGGEREREGEEMTAAIAWLCVFGGKGDVTAVSDEE